MSVFINSSLLNSSLTPYVITTQDRPKFRAVPVGNSLMDLRIVESLLYPQRLAVSSVLIISLQFKLIIFSSFFMRKVISNIFSLCTFYGLTKYKDVIESQSFKSPHLCKMRQITQSIQLMNYLFQSTHLCKMRPNVLSGLLRKIAISIHAPM